MDAYFRILLLTVVSFHMLAKASTQTLLSIIVIILCVCWWYILGVKSQYQTKQGTASKDDELMDVGKRKELYSEQYCLGQVPKQGLRFLKQNDGMLAVARSIAFVRMFDKARYQDILLAMDKLQKSYMYMLQGRYDARSQTAIMLDLRESVLENLYGLYFVVPQHLEHVYGVSPYKTIRDSIDTFSRVSRVMINVIKSFTHKTLKHPYFPMQLPAASDAPFNPMRNRLLP